MLKNDVILITGSTGMVGSNLYNKLISEGYSNIIAPGKNFKKIDLRNHNEVYKVFVKNKIKYVFHLAAKVGGIQANIDNPVSFLKDNLLINVNVFDCCHKFHVEKILYLGSSCIYPTKCKQPMKEEYLMDGKLEPTNEGYALSKICGLKLAEYYHKQYGVKTVCLMPCNIYGTNDHYDLKSSHVLSALIKRFSEAKDADAKEVVLWGTGTARREFIHVQDVIDAILYFFDKIDNPEIINIGPGKDFSIMGLAQIVKEAVGYKGKVNFDHIHPDGMMKKCLNVKKMEKYGFKPKVELLEGISRSIKEYKELCKA